MNINVHNPSELALAFMFKHLQEKEENEKKSLIMTFNEDDEEIKIIVKAENDSLIFQYLNEDNREVKVYFDKKGVRTW